MHHDADHQADLSEKETIRLTNNGRDGQLQHGLPDWLYEGDHDDDNYHDDKNDQDDDHDDYHDDDHGDDHGDHDHEHDDDHCDGDESDVISVMMVMRTQETDI